ncbi:MAG TPA: hypothetical protein VGP93_07410 [Polyangiaceae bacterium]|jgi:hypothetical protein|nr:hypothetical protein [Polyangiaceae bacterium]
MSRSELARQTAAQMLAQGDHIDDQERALSLVDHIVTHAIETSKDLRGAEDELRYVRRLRDQAAANALSWLDAEQAHRVADNLMKRLGYEAPK